VLAGENEPQAAVAQVTVQRTWGLAETSLVMTTLSATLASTCREAGVGAANATVIGIGGTIVIVAESWIDGSATDVAVSVTVDPDGIAAGA
jgi:hypothetical protein